MHRNRVECTRAKAYGFWYKCKGLGTRIQTHKDNELRNRQSSKVTGAKYHGNGQMESIRGVKVRSQECKGKGTVTKR